MWQARGGVVDRGKSWVAEFPYTEISRLLFPFLARLRYGGLVTTAITLTLLALPLFSQNEALKVSGPAPQRAQLMRSQAFFERNDGQVDKEVSYLSYGLGYSLFLTQNRATLVFHSRANTVKRSAQGQKNDDVVRLVVAGADPHAEVIGTVEQPGRTNYFSGSDPRLWHTDIPHFARVLYRHVYPGIDLVFYTKDGSLEYDFVAAAGANTNVIRFKLEGAAFSLTPAGDVLIKVKHHAPMTLKKPVVYQPGKEKRPIQARYSLQGNEIAFALGEYDHHRPGARLRIGPSETSSSRVACCPLERTILPADFPFDPR